MASHTIVAVYDTHAHADLAIADLLQAGIAEHAIAHYAQDKSSDVASSDPTLVHTKPAGGFWNWLTSEADAGDSHTLDSHTLYDRSIESGHTVVTVIAQDHDADHIASILEQHAPITMDEHPGEYGDATGEPMVAGNALGGTSTTASAFNGRTAETAGEKVISLAEETLQVGKRVVDAGVTRLRRYTVERPIEEQVRLRDETVSVFRRPVAATATVGADAFTDRTIEVNRTREEAVVSKTARVVEEVVLQKTAQDRVETVRDTVRREEVEVTGSPDGNDIHTAKP